jgi:hypothetical protein
MMVLPRRGVHRPRKDRTGSICPCRLNGRYLRTADGRSRRKSGPSRPRPWTSQMGGLLPFRGDACRSLPRPKRSISHFGWNAFLSAMFARVDLAEGRRHVSPARLRAGSATGFAGRRRYPHANLGTRRWPIAGMLPFRSTAERCSLAPHRPTWDQFGLKRHRRAAREEALHVGQDRFAYA